MQYPGSLQEEQAGEVVKTARSERRRVARERGGNPRLEGTERCWEWTPAGWTDGEAIFGNPYGGSEVVERRTRKGSAVYGGAERDSRTGEAAGKTTGVVVLRRKLPNRSSQR